MAWFDRFTRPWAATGQVVPPSDAQADAGFSFLGINPPTAELFNALFQDSDQKHRWLFENLRRIMAEAAIAPTAANTEALLAAVRALIRAQTDPLYAFRATDAGGIAALAGRVGTLEGKTGGRLLTRNYIGYTGAAGTYQFGADAWRAEIALIGGGGAGGQAPGPVPGGQGSSGPGGAAGSVSRFVMHNLVAVLGPNKRMTYYIGGGGAPTGAAKGADGQQSVLQSVESGVWAPRTNFLTAPGGFGGTGQGPNVSGTSGGQGSGGGAGTWLSASGTGYSTGAWSMTDGTGGHSGFSIAGAAAIGGHGGDGAWGGGGIGGGINTAGGSATNWGAGGGGSACIGGTTSQPGGYGFSGLLVVEEFSA